MAGKGFASSSNRPVYGGKGKGARGLGGKEVSYHQSVGSRVMDLPYAKACLSRAVVYITIRRCYIGDGKVISQLVARQPL